jgi:D-glycero-D-manno-heptose 1,7-bisphosphate phosphatase
VSGGYAGPTWPVRTTDDWCLFVDRDGVLNRRIEDDYVRNWADFEWLPGALGAMARLSRWAPYVVVVTNQQGVGKGLMSVGDLDTIHERMAEDVASAGGRLDAVLACPHLAELRCACRKPRTALAEGWLAVHPGVAAEHCVVVGDSWSDLAMGRVLTRGQGTCVWIDDGTNATEPLPTPDARFASLAELAGFVDATVSPLRPELSPVLERETA